MGKECKSKCEEGTVALRVSKVCSGCLPSNYDGKTCYSDGQCVSNETNIWYDEKLKSMVCELEDMCKIDSSETIVYCVKDYHCPKYLFRYGDACIKSCPAGTRNTSERLCEEPRDPVCAYMFKGLYWSP